MLAVKRSSLFFVKGLNFISFLINSRYLAIFNYFNVVCLPFLKSLKIFYFSSVFVYFFFKNIYFFKFLNPFCLIVFPSSLNDFFIFFKDFSSDLFLVGFSFDFFFFNSRFFFNLDFIGIDFFFVFLYCWSFGYCLINATLYMAFHSLFFVNNFKGLYVH
jgi:hypothetical protein